jgi:hypothetical protein
VANDPTQTYTIKIETDAAEQGREGADALQTFAEAIHGSEEKIKELASSLRRLKGTSDEVKGAKEQLKAKIDAERNSITQNNLALLKNGTSVKALGDAQKKAEVQTKKLHDEMRKGVEDKARKQTDGLKSAISATGGPVEGLASKFEVLGTITEGLGGAMGAVVVVALAAVAAIAALAAGVVAAAVSFAKFTFETQSAERSLNLFRVASTGSTENALHLGQQIDALGKKIRTPREELNKLGNELGKTRLRGQTYVDAFNAIGQASAALGDDVGSKLKELVTRGQYTQRFSLGAFELEGTGLHSDDVAAQLAKRMHIGINDARAALAEGRVTLQDGAAALRAAVEKQVAGVNLEALKDPAVAVQKLTDNLKALVRGVNIEPLLTDMRDLFSLFDSEETQTGAALKMLATALGGGMVDAAHQSTPVIKNFVRGTVLGALQIGVAYYKTKLAIKKAITDTFGSRELTGKIDGMKTAFMAGKFAAGALAGAILMVASSLVFVGALALGPSILISVGINAALKKFKEFRAGLRDTGAAIIDGLVSPLRKGAAAVREVANGLGNAVKKGVAEPLEIHSPSKVMQRYAEFTVDPFVDGIRAGVPKAARALDDLTAPAASITGGGSSGAHIELNVQINATHEVAKELAVPSVLEQMRRAMADVLRSAGLPVEKT